VPNARQSIASRSTFDAVCGALALVLPLLVTVLRVTPTPHWRDDLAVVQGLGFVPIGGQASPSTLFAQILALVPIGGRVLRAGLVGTASAALAGYALYFLTRRLLDRIASPSRLDPALSLTAALTATLSPTWQAECAAPGGIALAAALGLLALTIADGSGDDDVRNAFGLGAVLGLAFAESRLPAFVVAAALAARVVATGVVPQRRHAVAFSAGAVLLWAFFLLPLVVRPHAENAWVSLGPGLSGVDEPSRIAVRLRHGPFAAWAAQMGLIASVLGVGGLVWGIVRRPLRVATLPVSVFVLADCFLPAREEGALSADPVLAVRLLAVAALALGAAIGVRSAVAGLERLRIPFASSAAVLLVVYHFTLVFTAEEISADVVSADHLGADVWADEALGELPPNALLLVRTPTLAWRLWAARIARGDRPDVVVVPLGLLGRGSMARALCAEEPALKSLVRDFAMTGRTTEFALSAVADARPLFVEFDPDWDRSLLTHLRPTPLWLSFAPHTLGRSDRVRALADESGRRAFRRVIGAAKDRGRDDRATLAVVGAEVREHAVVLAALGDRDAARQVLADLARTDTHPSFVDRLTTQIESGARIDTRLLLE
jgi:hypothetical protein